MLATLLILAVGLASLLYVKGIIWPSKLNQLPYPPPSNWLFGNALFQIHDILNVALPTVKKYGTLFRMRFVYLPIVTLADPAAAGKLLRGGPSLIVKMREVYYGLEKFAGRPCPNLLTAEEDKDQLWRVARTAGAKAFAMKNIRLVLPAVIAATQDVIDHMRVKGVVDADHFFQCITVDVIGKFGYDREFGTCKTGSSEMLKIVKNMCTAVQGNLTTIFWEAQFWSKARWREAAYFKAYARLMGQLVQDLRERPPAEHTMAAHLLAARDSAGRPLPELRLRSELGFMFFAGFETTAHSLTVALMLIATHPEVQQRLGEELASLGLLAVPGHPPPRAVQWEDLPRMPYLVACINESQRYLSVVPNGTIRKLKEDFPVQGHVLPKGTAVWVGIHLIHHSEEVWESPQEFRPERWLPKGADTAAAVPAAAEGENEGGSTEVLGFMPFGLGHRSCVGMALAKLQLQVVLAMVCSQFTFKLVGDDGDPQAALRATLKTFKQLLTTKPVGGLPVVCTPRA